MGHRGAFLQQISTLSLHYVTRLQTSVVCYKRGQMTCNKKKSCKSFGVSSHCNCPELWKICGKKRLHFKQCIGFLLLSHTLQGELTITFCDSVFEWRYKSNKLSILHSKRWCHIFHSSDCDLVYTGNCASRENHVNLMWNWREIHVRRAITRISR